MKTTVKYIEEHCAGCIVHRSGENGTEILMIQPQSGSAWGLPKGHVERNESFEAAAVRETREETGMKVKITGTVPFPAVFRNSKLKKEVWFFVAEPTDPNESLVNSHETVCVAWWPISALPPIHAYQRGVVGWFLGQLDAKEIPHALPIEIEKQMQIAENLFPPDVNWMELKKEIMFHSPIHVRCFFSRRDPRTKKQRMNSFEKLVSEGWKARTGEYPVFRP